MEEMRTREQRKRPANRHLAEADRTVALFMRARAMLDLCPVERCHTEDDTGRGHRRVDLGKERVHLFRLRIDLDE